MDRKIQNIGPISDPDNFEKLFREYFSPLAYYAAKITGDMDSAREIVQSLFVKIWEIKDDMNLDKPLKAYLYTSVHNRCLNWKRDKSKYHTGDISDIDIQAENSPPGQDLLEQSELEARINDAINNLPDRCGQIFRLNRFEGMKYSEIAAALNISIKTVEAQMSKALKLLREMLKDYILLLLLIILTKIL